VPSPQHQLHGSQSLSLRLVDDHGEPRLSGDLFPLDRVPFTQATMLNRDVKKRKLEGMFGADEPAVYSGPEQIGKLIAWPNTKGTRENALENSMTRWLPWYPETPNCTPSGANLPLPRRLYLVIRVKRDDKTPSSMVHPSFETSTTNAVPRRAWAELSVGVGKGKRTLEVEVTARPLHGRSGWALALQHERPFEPNLQTRRRTPLSEPCVPRRSTEPKSLGSSIVAGERTVAEVVGGLR